MTVPNFELNDEYQALSDMVREFADTVVAPVSAKHDEEHSFPTRSWHRWGSWACSACHSLKNSAAWAGTTSPFP